MEPEKLLFPPMRRNELHERERVPTCCELCSVVEYRDRERKKDLGEREKISDCRKVGESVEFIERKRRRSLIVLKSMMNQ